MKISKVTVKKRRCNGSGYTGFSSAEAASRNARCPACGRMIGLRGPSRNSPRGYDPNYFRMSSHNVP